MCQESQVQGQGDAPAQREPRTGEYFYPGLGDKVPPGGQSVLLLTIGGVCVSGTWTNDGRFLGWAEPPQRNRIREIELARLIKAQRLGVQPLGA